MSAPDENKLNELRAAALEKELRKKEKDEANAELMASVESEGLELYSHRMMQETAHENDAGSVSRRGGSAIKTFIFFLVLAIGAGIAFFTIKSGSDGGSEESKICKTRCCDGTCSPSEGSGTCSYHGGIYHEGCVEEMVGGNGEKKR